MSKAIAKSELAQYEEVIEKHIDGFQKAGIALMAIREKKLYKDGYKTFEEYCDKRWKLKKSHAHRLMDAAQVMDNLSPNGGSFAPSAPMPSNERQTRELAKAPPEKQPEVWKKAVETAPDGRVTAAHVREVVEEEIPDEPEPVKDAADVVVPDQCLKAFQMGQELKSLCLAITRDCNKVAELCEDGKPGTRLIMVSTFKELARQLRQTLFAALPTHVCPYCEGSGCKPCEKQGLVNKSTYEAGKGERENRAK